jgi:hypothetical protein
MEWKRLSMFGLHIARMKSGVSKRSEKFHQTIERIVPTFFSSEDAALRKKLGKRVRKYSFLKAGQCKQESKRKRSNTFCERTQKGRSRK